MNNAKETFDRDRTEESIVDMDGISGGTDYGGSTGSPGSRFMIESTTASGDPIEVGSPILSCHSAAISSPAAPPPYSPERSSEVPNRGQTLTQSPTPPPISPHSRPSHPPNGEYGNASERDALRGDTYEDDEDEDEGSKTMSPRAPIITGVPTIELPDGKIVTLDITKMRKKLMVQ